MSNPFQQTPDVFLFVIGADDNRAIQSSPPSPLPAPFRSASLGEGRGMRSISPIIIFFITQHYKQISSRILENLFMLLRKRLLPFTSFP